jgi:hypothetical protein
LLPELLVHGVTIQKTLPFVLTAVITSEPTLSEQIVNFSICYTLYRNILSCSLHVSYDHAKTEERKLLTVFSSY